jgi:MinD-like ATPase involved in chromosome partitioning or flagellar assembly
VTPNEHDDPTTARDPEERANGTAEVTAVPVAEPVAQTVPQPVMEPTADGTPAAAAGTAAAAGLDEVPYDNYVNSGANPFSSVHPQGTSVFPRLLPRDFPEDEAPPDVPVMEQLHDPNALPGQPSTGGYHQAFAPVTSAFPPVPPDPYQAPRSPDEAPPLPGTPGHWSEVRADSKPEQAPPLSPPSPEVSAAPMSEFSAAPAFPASQSSFPASQSSFPASQSSFPADPPSFPAAPAAFPSVTSAFPAARSAGSSPSVEPPPPPSSSAPAPPVRETAESLTAELLLHGRRPPPVVGWRRTVYRATGGLIRVGESSAAVRRRDLVNRVRTPVAGGHHRVAVMSLKGGVGKTTTAVGLGATLATMRGDRVIAVDGNPDRGTLSDKVRLETSATIRDLLNERAQVARYADVRAYTSQASSRLEILASDRDPAVSVAFSADDYRAVARVLEHYYSICITDCGTGLLHSAMSGILELADHIVLVSSPSVDGARSASATLDWLEAHDYADLVRNCVVVLSTVRPKSKSAVDLDRLEQHFAARCKAVVRIPYDAHLEEGAEVELELLGSETADAYLQLSALVGEGFAVPRRPVSRITATSRFA